MLPIAALLLACGCTPTPLPRPKVTPAHEGAAAYERYCALCHGAEGEGYIADHATQLANASFLRIASDQFLTESIARGRPGTPMSAWAERFGGPLSDRDIRNLVLHLRSFSDEPPEPIDATRTPGDDKRGPELYGEQCVECHGERGEGLTAVSLRNRVFQELASDDFLRRSITEGRPGTPMRAFGGELTPEQIEDLVAHVRAFGKREERRDPEPDEAQEGPRIVAREVWDAIADEDLVLNPDGSAPHFQPERGHYVTGRQIARALDEGRRMILLDARPPSDWAVAHVPGALPEPFYSDESSLERLPKDGTWIAVYCGCPHHAADQLATRLTDSGYENIVVLDDGFGHWMSDDYPVVRGPTRF